jgi:hypothetical protein
MKNTRIEDVVGTPFRLFVGTVTGNLNLSIDSGSRLEFNKEQAVDLAKRFLAFGDPAAMIVQTAEPDKNGDCNNSCPMFHNDDFGDHCAIGEPTGHISDSIKPGSNCPQNKGFEG